MTENRRDRAALAFVGFVAWVVALSPGAAAEIVRIGNSAGGVSADGMVVAGGF